VSSGTDAILLALMTAGIGPGDEVLCPTFTFFATAGCIVRVGATPVFVDSEPGTFNMDPADATRRITAQTKAIVPVHLFGQCAPMDEIMGLASDHDLMVIEDAAQSFGATDRGRQAGTIGTFGAYSLFPSKNLGGFGDGGLLVTNDDGLAEKARLLRAHGAKPKYHHKAVGGNFRLDALQAALIAVKLPHLARYVELRRNNAAQYAKRLGELPQVALSSQPDASEHRLILPAEFPVKGHTWNQYTLRVPGVGRRDALRAHLDRAGIGTEIYYPVPMHAQECFRSLAVLPNDFPVASRLAAEVLSIPIYPELGFERLDKVVLAIAGFLGHEKGVVP
jgi:dTDP-4-amino-4,6-dideoxygalactose transaminase